MKKLILTFLLLCLFLSIGLAQPGGDPTPENPAPISGIEFLIGGGVLLGLKKCRKYFVRNK
jgi:hypothetical protein